MYFPHPRKCNFETHLKPTLYFWRRTKDSIRFITFTGLRNSITVCAKDVEFSERNPFQTQPKVVRIFSLILNKNLRDRGPDVTDLTWNTSHELCMICLSNCTIRKVQTKFQYECEILSESCWMNGPEMWCTLHINFGVFLGNLHTEKQLLLVTDDSYW